MAQSPKAADIWPCVSLFLPILAMLANVVCQILLVRMRKGLGFMRSIVEGGMIGGALLAALEICLIAGPRGLFELPLFLLINAPTYCGLAYCYFCFATLGNTSIRIRLYAEVSGNPAGISEEAFKKEYNEAALMQLRVDRLVGGGDIIDRDGRYFTGKARLVRIAGIMRAIKVIFIGRPSQFE